MTVAEWHCLSVVTDYKNWAKLKTEAGYCCLLLPVALAAGELSVALSTDKSEYASGESATFTGTFTNTSGTPCRLHSTVKSRVWTVTSGSVTTWTTSGCSLSGKPKRAKLTATSSATTSTSWDGHRNDSSCTTGAAASPGTYVLRGTFDGVTAKPAVFHVVS